MTDAELETLIRRRAHEMWQREGCPEGHALRHWLDAERRVLEEVAYAAAMRNLPAQGTGVDEGQQPSTGPRHQSRRDAAPALPGGR